MPIIRGDITETVDISTNGTHNVAKYTSANVNVQPSISSLNVTPTTSAQTITAPSGTDGYSPVNVSAVTAAIDANITAGNIKKNVSILGVTGSYEGSGGGSSNTLSQYVITANGDAIANEAVLDSTTFADIITINYKALNSLCYNIPTDNITGDIIFHNLVSVEESGLSYAFRYCGNLESNGVDLSSLTTVGVGGLEYFCDHSHVGGKVDLSSLTTVNSRSFNNAFSYTNITEVDLSALTTVGSLSSSPFEHCFQYCGSLTTLHFDSLENIGYRTFYRAFGNCSALSEIEFPSLSSVGEEAFSEAFCDTSLVNLTFPSLSDYIGSKAFWYAFSGCYTLKSISFPTITAETFGNVQNAFNSMLSGCQNVVVRFPPEMENIITQWSDYNNGFGGTNTTVRFNLGQLLTVSIPAEVDNLFVNSEEVYDGDEVLFDGETNDIVIRLSNGRLARYTFVPEPSDTTFTPITSGYTFADIWIRSEVPDLDSLTVTAIPTGDYTFAGDLQPDLFDSGDAKICYVTPGFTLTVDAYKEGYTSFPDDIEVDSTITITYRIKFYEEDVTTYTPQQLYDLMTLSDQSYSQYVYVDPNDGYLKFHDDVDGKLHYSGSFQISFPQGSISDEIRLTGYVSSESNYDFGYLYLDEQPVDLDYNQVKNNNYPSGYLAWKQSGQNNVESVHTIDITNISRDYTYLTLGYAHDETLRGDNTFYIAGIDLVHYVPVSQDGE